MNSKIELLAPAGNMTCLHAAASAGADAVYLGAGSFNARRGAGNFTLEELREACDYAHLRGVNVYLTLNTIILPSEVPDALELARQAWRAGVDAFIIQDPGLAKEISRTIPEARIHASTQMNIHTVDGLLAARLLGAKRVTLARELSLDEVANLSSEAEKLGMEVEVFAHGALCMCYSGQCFMSSMVGERSANRGLCAQACRLPYTLHNRAVRKTIDTPGPYLLSPKDLCTADILPELLAAGVSSLKIEGRMKSPEYVSAVVSTYRRLLDQLDEWRCLQGANESAEAEVPVDEDASVSRVTDVPRATEEDIRYLQESFSRGFTHAYLEGERGNEIMGYERPNNRGVRIGRVTDVRGSKITIDDKGQIEVGDVLEFWTSRGNFAHTVAQLDRTKNGFAVVSEVKGALSKGDRVFRVRMASQAFEDSAHEPRVPVAGTISLALGKPLVLTLSTEDGRASVSVEGPIAEAARTKAVTAEEVAAHIDRFGNTPFELAHLNVDVEEGIGIGFSVLHKLKDKAAAALVDELLQPWRSRELQRIAPLVLSLQKRPQKCIVVALATNPACARAAKKAGADALYVPVLNYARGEAVIAGQLSPTAEQAGYPKHCISVLPVAQGARDALKDADFDIYKRVKEGEPVLCEQLGQVIRALELGALPEVGPHVPVTNRLDLDLMNQLGVTRTWLSPELTLDQIGELGEVAPLSLGYTIMGQTELMVTEHCVLMSQGPCAQECATCSRRKSPFYLKDRKGYEIPVVTDKMGRSHLYNAVSTDVAHAVPDLISAGVSALMVDTTLMTVAETSKKVTRAVRARDIALKSGDRVSKAEGATTGHLFRGVR